MAVTAMEELAVQFEPDRGKLVRFKEQNGTRETRHSRSLHLGSFSLFRKSSVFCDIWPGGTRFVVFQLSLCLARLSKKPHLDPFQEP
jgi:hypothetical protein